MDARILPLLDLMEAATADNWNAIRREIVSLMNDLPAEEDRVIVLEAHTLLYDEVERAGGISKPRTDQIRSARREEYQRFLAQEAQDEFGIVDPRRLAVLVGREVEAGRLAWKDEFRDFATAGAEHSVGDYLKIRAQAMAERA